MLGHNMLWNLAGMVLPLLVGIITVPMLTRSLGVERYGILTLAYATIGYFSLFDLGIGRALTQVIAQRLGSGRKEEIPGIVWSAVSVMGIMAIGGMVLLHILSPWLIHHILKVPTRLSKESIHAFHLLAIAIPIIMGHVAMRGFLEAFQKFAFIGAVQTAIGTFGFVGPVVILQFTNSLVAVITFLILIRLAALTWIVVECFRVLPSLRSKMSVRLREARSLLRIGGWITVSNIVGPIMTYLDRFLVAGIVGVGALAYYTLPYDLIIKLLVIPGAISGVLFPAFSAMDIQYPTRKANLFAKGSKFVFVVTFPLALMIVLLAREGLRIWLGEDFEKNGTLVAQILAISVFINGLAYVPFGLVQGIGRSDLTAKLHLIELPLYLLLLVLLLNFFGIVGAALASIGRIVVDTFVLLVWARRDLSFMELPVKQLLLLLASIALMAAATIPLSLPARIWMLAVSLLGHGMISWVGLMTDSEREIVLDRLGHFYGLIRRT